MFGGAFDPPHNGHMALLRSAIAAAAPSQVLVIPSGTSPHKRHSTTPGPLRAQMCACFTPLFPQLVVSHIELQRPSKSYTCDTLRQLQAQMPGASLFLCIGGDMLRSFTGWRQYRAILHMATLVVAGRGHAAADADAAAQLRQEGGQLIFAPGHIPPISSTQVRAMAAAGQDIAPLVPPPVRKIIVENRLYTEKTEGV